MKKKLKLMMVMLSLTTITMTISAAPTKNTNIFVNGEKEAVGFIEDDRSYIPLRAVSEALGSVVDWDAKSKTVTLSKDGTTIIQKIGESTAMVNGQTVDAGVPAQIKDAKTYVPLRFVSETLGAEVEWVSQTRSVHITAEGVLSKEDRLKEKYKQLVEKAKPIVSFDMKPITSYTPIEKVPGSPGRKAFKEIAFTDTLPIRIDHSNVVLDIGTTRLKDGLEVLEVTLSVVNRDIPNPIVYASKKTGFMVEATQHIQGETETLLVVGDGSYIIKQKYYLPDNKRNGISKKDLDGIGFTSRQGEYGEIVKTLVVKTNL